MPALAAPPPRAAPRTQPVRRLADIMTRRVVTARCDQPIDEIINLLGRHQIGGLPVLDEQGVLAGVLSQSDLAAHMTEISDETRAEQLMAPFICYATADTGLDETADLMLAHDIHRVIVMQDDVMVGIVSSLDLLRAYRNSGRRTP